MNQFPSSSFEWTSMTNEEYQEKNDSRFSDLFENVAARCTYPSLALVAIIETIGSAIAAVLVSISVIFPVGSRADRKVHASNLGKAAALSGLAVSLDVLGFFSPGLTSRGIAHITSRFFPEKTEEKTKISISTTAQNPPVESSESESDRVEEQKAESFDGSVQEESDFLPIASSTVTTPQSFESERESDVEESSEFESDSDAVESSESERESDVEESSESDEVELTTREQNFKMLVKVTDKLIEDFEENSDEEALQKFVKQVNSFISSYALDNDLDLDQTLLLEGDIDTSTFVFNPDQVSQSEYDSDVEQFSESEIESGFSSQSEREEEESYELEVEDASPVQSSQSDDTPIFSEKEIRDIVSAAFQTFFNANSFSAQSNESLITYSKNVFNLLLHEHSVPKEALEKVVISTAKGYFSEWKEANIRLFRSWLENFDNEFKSFVVETWREIFGIVRSVDIDDLKEQGILITEISTLYKVSYDEAKQNFAHEPEFFKTILAKYSDTNRKDAKDFYGQFFWEKAHSEALARYLDLLKTHRWFQRVNEALLTKELDNCIFNLKPKNPEEMKATMKNTVSAKKRGMRGKKGRTHRYFPKAGNNEDMVRHQNATYYLRNLHPLLDRADEHRKELMEQNSDLSPDDADRKTLEYIEEFKDEVFGSAPSFLIS